MACLDENQRQIYLITVCGLRIRYGDWLRVRTQRVTGPGVKRDVSEMGARQIA